MSIEPRRILVIRRKAIGDVVVSMAVLRSLREAWPNARIHLLVDSATAPVVRGSPWVDHLVVYHRRRREVGGPWRRVRSLWRWFRRLRALRYDLVLDLMGTPQTALWSFITGAATRVGRRRRYRSWAYTQRLPSTRGTATRFAGDEMLDWARWLGLEASWQPTEIPVPPELRQQVENYHAALPERRGPRVMINPSASWSAKAWPPAHFGRLARMLSEEGAQVLVAWGPGEEDLRDQVVSAAAGAARPIPPTDLTALAAHLAAVDLVVTTDSGPKHMAVAMGTPTLTLFGSTNPAGWHPQLPGHRWLTHPTPCHPCDRLECNVAGHPCLDGLEPSVVMETVRAMLSAEATGS